MSAYRCRACGAGVSVPKTGARAGRVPRLCLTCRLAEVEQDLAELREAHARPVFEVLSPAEQDAKSWAVIERWHAHKGEGRPALDVTFLGPYIGVVRECTYYARLPNGVTKRGATRSDALAHLAGWCQEHPFG